MSQVRLFPQEIQLRPLQLQLTLEKTRTEQLHELRVLGIITYDEMKSQSHLNILCKIVPKTIYFYFLNSDTTYTLNM